MSAFGNFINDNATSLFGSIAGLFTQGATNRTNLKMMRETNQFNAQEAAKQRDWEARQAEIARDWQEDFYNTYESPEAMVRQYQGAGLNPALLYQNAGSGSVPSASIPSGAAASGTTPPYMDAGPLLQTLDNLVTLKTRLDNMKSGSILNRANADKAVADADLDRQNIAESQSRIDLNDANIILISKKIDNMLESTKNLRVQRELMQLEKTIKKFSGETLRLDYLKKQWEQDFKDRYGFYPEFSKERFLFRALFGAMDYYSSNRSSFDKPGDGFTQPSIPLPMSSR